MSHMNRMIFVTGFAFAGTSRLRDCIAVHPGVTRVPDELPLFETPHSDRHTLVEEIRRTVAGANCSGTRFVSKTTANGRHIDQACRLLPESKFVFIIRDPRDVFISYERGPQARMGGQNSHIAECMKITRRCFKGYKRAGEQPNLLLLRYEDLHQDLSATMERIYQFLGLHADEDFLNQCFAQHNIISCTGGCTEDRDSPHRDEEVGKWVNIITPSEVRWFKRRPFWTRFMNRFGYGWDTITYQSILEAMITGGVHDMGEDDLLQLRIRADRPNLLLQHDIDLLQTEDQRQSVLTIARIEGETGIASVFNFLPLDDMRYEPLRPESVIQIIGEVRQLAPQAVIGLHLNATERFFPASMPEAGFDHPQMTHAIAYLHKQIDDYAAHGIEFRFATAHGYGRREKEPNNTSQVFRDELASRGIQVFDADLWLRNFRKATHFIRLHDVGGALAMKIFPNNGRVDNPETYEQFPAGSLINFLIHPGNYDVRRPLTLGLRTNILGRRDLQKQPERAQQPSA